MRIFLVGYMGSGKTRTGKELSALTGHSFVDTDQIFEERYRISIFDFFEKYGEESFRKIERDILLETLEMQNVVIATGGGTPCFFNNMEMIMSNGICFYLRLDADILADRLSTVRKKRPLLKGKYENELGSFIRGQLAERELFYNRAHHIVRQGRGTVEEIIRIIGSELK